MLTQTQFPVVKSARRGNSRYGLGNPVDPAAQAATEQSLRLFSFWTPVYGGPDGSPRGLPVTAPQGPGFPTRLGCRPSMETKVAVITTDPSEAIMANFSTSTGTSALSASDLHIEITQRGPTVFRGTAEQLRAEGLIPDGFTWPTGDASVSFALGKFSCALSRCRPEGMHGPKSAWTSGDYWCFRRGLASQPVRGFQANEIFEATAAMLEAVKRATPWGEYVQKRAHRAKQDSRYWAFRQQLLGEQKRKPGRPYKNTAQEQS